MEVLIVGSGGREHALALSLSESDSVDHVHTCPDRIQPAGVEVDAP